MLQTVAALGLIYCIKIIVVYVYLYVLIPRWVEAPGKWAYYIAGVLLLLAGTWMMRLVTQQVIWVYIYGEVAPRLNFAQVLARYFYSLLDLVQISAICIAVRLFSMRINAVKKEKMLIREKLNAEMLHLKAQTNPHFLFNTLNSIFSLSRQNSPHTPDAVMKLSHILRYMLYETSAAVKPLQDELQVLQDFMALQAIRFGDRIRVELQLDIDDPGTPVAPLLLLPLMENAYKHSNERDALICCNIVLADQQLSINISNPVGEVPFAAEESEGIGLGNIRRQLALLYRKYSLVCNREQDQFTVLLEIDLETYAENELFDHRG